MGVSEKKKEKEKKEKINIRKQNFWVSNIVYR